MLLWTKQTPSKALDGKQEPKDLIDQWSDMTLPSSSQDPDYLLRIEKGISFHICNICRPE